MADLHTTYLGLPLRSPIVASAGPLTSEVETIVALEEAGVGAVVLRSLFEEQIEHEMAEVDRLFSLHRESFVEAASFRPDLAGTEDVLDRHLRLVEDAREAVDVPVIASLNGTNIGGWLRYARLVEAAGATAIELNLYTIAADPSVTADALESEQFELVSLLADELSVPLAVKISPYYSSLAAFVVALQEAGAAGVVMFNRFYQPDLDLETLEVMPRLALSTPEEVRLPLRWTGLLRDYLSMSIAASGGVHSGDDVAKLLLAGADVAMTTSAVLRHGPTHVATIEAGLRDWMGDHEYTSVDELRGAVRRDATPDPIAYERANYIGNLVSYTSKFVGGPLDLWSR